MDKQLTLRDLLGSFFRQIKTFKIVFSVVVIAGIIYIATSPRLYQSSGSLLVKFGADAELGVNKDTRTTQMSAGDHREIIQSNMDILQSHDLLKDVLTTVGVSRVYPEIVAKNDVATSALEEAIYKFERQHLVVKSSLQSNIIDINILNTNPEIAAQIATLLQDKFIERQLEVFNKPQTAFLQEQIKIAEQKLNKSQQQLRDFKASVGISSLEAELTELLRQKTDAAAVSFQSVDDAQNKLAELHDKEAEMLATYKSNSSALKSVRQSIAEVERQIEQKRTNLNTPTASSQPSAIEQRITLLEEQRGHYEDLVRQVTIDEDNYKHYLEKSEEARINKTLGDQKITSISVVDRPTITLKPVKPRKTILLISYLFGGILLGGFAVLLREVFDETFRTPKQLSSALQLPVITSFPAKDSAAHLLGAIENFYNENPQSIIQFASTYNDEGVEKLARDIAAMAIQRGRKILLVDNDAKMNAIEKEKFNFDLTIIATPSIISDANAQSLSKLSDACIFVVEAEKTRTPVAKEAVRLITSQGGKIIGTVLMNRHFYIPKKIYNLLYK